MTDDERLERAERFVRDAIKHFGSKPTEDEIQKAVLKAAKCLPPFTAIGNRRA